MVLSKNNWWGVKERQNRGLFSKITWDTICIPKCSGGLGFRKMWNINRALITKLGWAMTIEEDRLWVNIFKAKYMCHEQFRYQNAKQGSSWIWQGIVNCKDLVAKGACVSIGNDVGINIWEDPFIPWVEDFIPS